MADNGSTRTIADPIPLEPTQSRAVTDLFAVPSEGTANTDPDQVVWNVVESEFAGVGRLYRVVLRRGDSRAETFDKIRASINSPRGIRKFIKEAYNLGKAGVYEGSILSTLIDDVEGPRTFVELGPLSYDNHLSNALHQRLPLGVQGDFVSANVRFAQSDKAMVIAYRLSKTYIARGTLLGCAAFLGVSALIGIMSKNADLGVSVVEVGVAVLAVTAFVLMKVAA